MSDSQWIPGSLNLDKITYEEGVVIQGEEPIINIYWTENFSLPVFFQIHVLAHFVIFEFIQWLKYCI